MEEKNQDFEIFAAELNQKISKGLDQVNQGFGIPMNEAVKKFESKYNLLKKKHLYMEKTLREDNEGYDANE